MSRNSLNETTQKDGGGWGWFAPPKSLISSVSSITNQILSTVENGLNIPDPEDLAKEEMLIGNRKVVVITFIFIINLFFFIQMKNLPKPRKKVQSNHPKKKNLLDLHSYLVALATSLDSLKVLAVVYSRLD